MKINVRDDYYEKIGKNLKKFRKQYPALYHHCRRTAVISYMIAIYMGLVQEDAQEIAIGAILHDIGKTELPDKILQKKERLSMEQFEVIRRHSELGYQMVENSEKLSDVCKNIILKHHEKLDGSGYPHGIKKIPLHVQIVTISSAESPLL